MSPLAFVVFLALPFGGFAHLWCQTEPIHAFESAKDYLGLPLDDDPISESDVQTIIEDAFLRVKCDEQDLGSKTCQNVSLCKSRLINGIMRIYRTLYP